MKAIIEEIECAPRRKVNDWEVSASHNVTSFTQWTECNVTYCGNTKDI